METYLVDKKRIRKSFGKIKNVTPLPNLIEVQKRSFDNFLQLGEDPLKRIDHGLHGVFKSVFPVNDYTERATVNYVSYDFGQPKYDVLECSQRGMTFSAPLHVTFQLVVWDINEEENTKTIRDAKTQQVHLCDIPLMTKDATFVVNGTERVVVSQMHRSPGVFFDHDRGKTHMSGKFLFSSRVIPYRGSWLDFEYDTKDLLFARIDRKRKFPATTFLKCLLSNHSEKYLEKCEEKKIEPDPNLIQGMTGEEILNYFYKSVKFKKDKFGWTFNFDYDFYKGKILPYSILNSKTGKELINSNSKITLRLIKDLEKKYKEVSLSEESMIGMFISEDIIDEKNGKIFIEAGAEITHEHFEYFEKNNIKQISILQIDNLEVGPYIRNTLVIDKAKSREEALFEIYKILRPGEPPTLETAELLFKNLFFSNNRYDLSSVGRVKMNSRLKMNTDIEKRFLSKIDILEIIKVLFHLKDGKDEVDDIDHLGNRRVRSVGELLENNFRMGLLRMERAIKERMSSVEVDTIMPQDIVNAKTVASSIKEFFGTSQLSQFMDQTNPLGEITHKRRVSALGPGGLSRERAGFEVRDVHQTHYGRICPVETPEGPNIGLINSLASYSRINPYGFIETPYRIVNNGKVTSKVIYLSAMEEEDYVIAQANALVDENDKFIEEMISCRKNGEFIISEKSSIDLMDVSPQQLVSVSSSLIPFIENDDANRALMGSNMMRQAVPLIQTEAPLVGTGMEQVVARDSGATVISKRSGYVDQVDANRIVIRVTENNEKQTKSSSKVDIYNLLKYQKSNQNTCINQRPLVNVGDFINGGDIIADGPATDLGELALGRNVLVAFMPWNGYNFEDSIIISERIVRDDVFSSIHVEEFEVLARDTKLGPEEITRDIPNTSEDNLRNLDETGMIYIGANVKPGDILIGKVTPKGETPITPEEKLLKSIFGEKASDVKDTSLKVPPGVEGTVVEIRVFSRRGIEKDERSLSIERSQIERLAQDRDDEINIIEKTYTNQLRDIFNEQILISGTKKFTANHKLSYEDLEQLNKEELLKIKIKNTTYEKEISQLTSEFNNLLGNINQKFETQVDKIQSGDELLPGVLKMIKVFVAVKRKLQPGDKMAGRHGNKGVISKIAPIEDMPMLKDGTPVDVLLNPLGVPSRMNIGQIFETHLGWASTAMGNQINKMLKEMHSEGQSSKLRNNLSKIYTSSEHKNIIKNLNEDDLVELSTNLSKGIPFATPVFDGAKEEDITKMLEEAGLSKTGQEELYDGISGDKFERPVTVGYIYMLKLHHLADEKIHARSIGPYSLVTQQPLGGKAQFGGQRFGEMEVWALEAYGASHTLQEMLTIKSDDVAGRTKVYESIIKGDQNFETGIPESFNVMVKELKSLCLNIEMQSEEKNENLPRVEN
tara:strand:+ start:74 stop:4276 length:4203 start_codon:yes stop_codon:yes gene_type:complete